MDITLRKTIKKASNGLGFMLFAVILVMYAVVLAFVLSMRGLSDAAASLINMFASIASMFLVGLFYCLFSRTRISSVIQFSRVGLGRLTALVAMGLTVAVAGDFITELLGNNLQMIGMRNNVDLNAHSSTPLNNILTVISIAIIPPLSEEFLFRGIVLGKLRRFGDGFAIVLSSALFALLHMNIVQIPFAFVVGLVMAFVTVKTNSLLPAILIHFANNFRSIIINLLVDSKIMSENLLDIVYIIFLMLVFGAGIYAAVKFSRDKDFFRIKNESEVSFSSALGASICTGGMITYIVIVLLMTATTVGFG